jgi:hypothetical protein
MKKILGFDSWVGGAHNYGRLVQSFSLRDLNLQLLHIGSWGTKQLLPDYEVIDGLVVKDISFYHLDFQKILELEKPSAVIFLSTHTFAHRAFNRYCMQSGIPTLHLYHGIMGVMSQSSSNPGKVNIFSRFDFIFSRIFKVFTKILPIYCISLFKTGACPKEWIRFVKDGLNLLIHSKINFSVFSILLVLFTFCKL